MVFRSRAKNVGAEGGSSRTAAEQNRPSWPVGSGSRTASDLLFGGGRFAAAHASIRPGWRYRLQQVEAATGRLQLRGLGSCASEPQGRFITGADLSDLDLSGMDLRGAHFEGATLAGAHLTKSHLEGAHFERTDLAQVDVTGADLVGAVIDPAFESLTKTAVPAHSVCPYQSNDTAGPLTANPTRLSNEKLPRAT